VCDSTRVRRSTASWSQKGEELLDFVRLTDEQRRSLDNDGFLVVRDALDSDTVGRLVDGGDRLASLFVNKPELLDKSEYNHLDLRPGLMQEKAFVDLVAHSSTVPLVIQALSPNIHLHSIALIYKRPENPSAAPFRRGWHRDIRIARDLGHRGLPRVGIKVCYCLSDFHSPDSGMTLFARGSHLSDDALAIPKDHVDPNDLEVCDLILNAGDAVLFENRIFHTAAPNRSNRMSRVVMYGYAYRWMKPEVYLDAADQEYSDQLDGITRQLLGGYRDVDTRPWALERWAKRHGVQPAPVPWTVEV
jgi:ectoine hydroxylase-related dioxygenase (phytanoyl-CoA dioxygenase family)